MRRRRRRRQWWSDWRTTHVSRVSTWTVSCRSVIIFTTLWRRRRPLYRTVHVTTYTHHHNITGHAACVSETSRQARHVLSRYHSDQSLACHPRVYWLLLLFTTAIFPKKIKKSLTTALLKILCYMNTSLHYIITLHFLTWRK